MSAGICRAMIFSNKVMAVQLISSVLHVRDTIGENAREPRPFGCNLTRLLHHQRAFGARTLTEHAFTKVIHDLIMQGLAAGGPAARASQLFHTPAQALKAEQLG